MSALPRAGELRNVSVTTLFWEEMEDEHDQNFMKVDVNDQSSNTNSANHRGRTLLSQTFSHAPTIDIDDLFNDDCFLESLSHRAKTLTPTKPTKRLSK